MHQEKTQEALGGGQDVCTGELYCVHTRDQDSSPFPVLQNL